MKNTTPTPRQIAERARRKAMPIALIQKPLRLIESEDWFTELDSKGVPRKVAGPSAIYARYMASHGDGAAVNRIARQFA